MVKNIRKREQQDVIFSETAYDLISKKGAGLAEVTTNQRQTLGQEPRPRILLKEVISYEMYRASDTYKNIFKGVDENLKEIQDKIDCLQRSQVYLHNHISKVENDINQLNNLMVRRLTDVESYDVQMAEVN